MSEQKVLELEAATTIKLDLTDSARHPYGPSGRKIRLTES